MEQRFCSCNTGNIKEESRWDYAMYELFGHGAMIGGDRHKITDPIDMLVQWLHLLNASKCYYDIEQATDDIDHHYDQHQHNHYHDSTEMGETERNSYVSSYMNGESFHKFPLPPPPLVIAAESFEEHMR
ncbi:hypothetical protein Bca4012_017890 [Brassica carinata]|uniref:Uncharacterized protein n=1 Tax=Brassica carinata TaxID=52824 RepID=A0A8X7WNP1_BRACI|nr:hypothetical protein Bca52824_003720 [Brassica carinata]